MYRRKGKRDEQRKERVEAVLDRKKTNTSNCREEDRMWKGRQRETCVEPERQGKLCVEEEREREKGTRNMHSQR